MGMRAAEFVDGYHAGVKKNKTQMYMLLARENKQHSSIAHSTRSCPESQPACSPPQDRAASVVVHFSDLWVNRDPRTIS